MTAGPHPAPLDHGRRLAFGVSLSPDAASSSDLRRTRARRAEELGLDLIAVQDHPYHAGFLETWTLLEHLLTSTDRIAVVSDVLDLQLRLPSMVAKAAATSANLHPGRLRLGVGSGASAQGIASMGGQHRSPAETVGYTHGALQILRAALAGRTVSVLGAHHRVTGYAAGPPAPGVDIWLGSNGPRMLEAVGTYADGWISPLNIYAPPDAAAGKQQRIDAAARAAGRRPADIARIYNITGTIGDRATGPGMAGGPELWVETLTAWTVGLGFDTYIFWPTDDEAQQTELFARHVVPGVREHVARRRAR